MDKVTDASGGCSRAKKPAREQPLGRQALHAKEQLPFLHSSVVPHVDLERRQPVGEQVVDEQDNYLDQVWLCFLSFGAKVTNAPERRVTASEGPRRTTRRGREARRTGMGAILDYLDTLVS